MIGQLVSLDFINWAIFQNIGANIFSEILFFEIISWSFEGILNQSLLSIILTYSS